MSIPTEPFGSTPRTQSLLNSLSLYNGTDPALDPLYEDAAWKMVARFEATGSPAIHGERNGDNSWTCSVQERSMTTRNKAFAKIRSRMQVVALASAILGAA
jgi:hypothetical protein